MKGLALLSFLRGERAIQRFAVWRVKGLPRVAYLRIKNAGRAQLDGSVHDLRLGGVLTQLLRGLLRHIAEADQQGIQGFGDLP